MLEGLGPRGDGAGHAGVLGLDFEEGSCTIEAISLRGMARGCLFVGDTITHVDQTPVRDALELRAALPTDGRGVRLRLRQPAVEAWIAQRPHETVTFAAWVIVRGAESGAAGGAAGGPAGGVAGAARAATGCMRVMLVGSQRVRLLKLDVLGTKLGGLHPTLVGQLSKHGEQGKVSLSRWKTRRFELQGGSLVYYRPEDAAMGAKPKGTVSLSDRRTTLLSDATGGATGSQHRNGPLCFDVVTPTRRYTLMAPDAATKNLWLSAITAAVGQPAARLVLVEEVGCVAVVDRHVLEIVELGSDDDLVSHLRLRFAVDRSDGRGVAAELSISAPALPPPPAPRAKEVEGEDRVVGEGEEWASPSTEGEGVSPEEGLLAWNAACAFRQAYWQLTVVLGVPLHPRPDRWLTPRSSVHRLPLRFFDLLCRLEPISDAVDASTDASAANATDAVTKADAKANAEADADADANADADADADTDADADADVDADADARGRARRQSLERSNCYLTATTPAEGKVEDADTDADAEPFQADPAGSAGAARNTAERAAGGVGAVEPAARGGAVRLKPVRGHLARQVESSTPSLVRERELLTCSLTDSCST